MREITDELQKSFESLIARTADLTRQVPPEDLFWKPEKFENSYEMFSVGEFVLRSGAVVEQAFAGITTRLWDDPFEWTLPEYMASPDRIIEYMDEVAETVNRGFAFLHSDDDLKRQTPAPRELRTILQILLSAFERSAHFQGRAAALYQLISGKKPSALPQ